MKIVCWGLRAIPLALLPRLRINDPEVLLALQIPPDAGSIDYSQYEPDALIRAKFSDFKALSQVLTQDTVLVLDAWNLLLSDMPFPWSDLESALSTRDSRLRGAIIVGPVRFDSLACAHPMFRKQESPGVIMDFFVWADRLFEVFINMGIPCRYLSTPPTLRFLSEVVGNPDLAPVRRIGHWIVPHDSLKYEAHFSTEEGLVDAVISALGDLENEPEVWPNRVAGEQRFCNRDRCKQSGMGLILGSSWAKYCSTDAGSSSGGWTSAQLGQLLYFLAVVGLENRP